MTQGGHYVIMILPIKSKMITAKKPCFTADDTRLYLAFNVNEP